MSRLQPSPSLPHGSTSRAPAETTAETHKQSDCRAVASIPYGYICKTLLCLRLREHFWKGDRKIARTRQEFAGKLCLLLIPEILIKSHQHECPNVNWRRVTSVSLPNWTGKSPGDFSITQRTPGSQARLGRGDESFPRKCTTIGFPVPNSQSWNLHTGSIIWTEQVVFTNIYVYIYIIYAYNNN